MRFAAFALALSFVLAPGAKAQPQANVQTIALDLSGPRPSVSVSINGGAPELWVFDTGAGGSVMNIDRATALNLPHEADVRLGSPAGGTPQLGFMTTLTNVTLGGVSLPSMHVAAAPAIMADRTGVLSPNVFRGQLVTFDFGHAQVRVSAKNARTLPTGVATAYMGNNGHVLPAIQVTLGSQSWIAHIDTGAPGGLTFPYTMASSLPLAGSPTPSGHARFVDGVHDRYHAQINGTVQVGPLTLVNPDVEFIDGLPNLNIGMGLLTRMTITLDPEEQRDWAAANPTGPGQVPAPAQPASR
jgi:hypothetical protein